MRITRLEKGARHSVSGYDTAVVAWSGDARLRGLAAFRLGLYKLFKVTTHTWLLALLSHLWRQKTSPAADVPIAAVLGLCLTSNMLRLLVHIQRKLRDSQAHSDGVMPEAKVLIFIVIAHWIGSYPTAMYSVTILHIQFNLELLYSGLHLNSVLVLTWSSIILCK